MARTSPVATKLLLSGTPVEVVLTLTDGGRMKKQKGFSLIELLIVVAIILIIAAIAIPNLLRAKIAANESSAVSSLRTINTAEVSYTTAYPTVGYSAKLADMGPGATNTCPAAGPAAANACLIDNVLASGTKSGYTFVETPTASGGINTQYVVITQPLTFNQSGVRNFCSVEDAVIRYGTNGTPPTDEASCAALAALQ